MATLLTQLQQAQQAITILRRQHVEGRFGCSRSTLYQKIADGLFTPPVSLGARAVGWPSYEVDAILAAMVAGRSQDEIRELVSELTDKRQHAA